MEPDDLQARPIQSRSKLLRLISEGSQLFKRHFSILVHCCNDLLVEKCAVWSLVKIQYERIVCDEIACFSKFLGSLQEAGELPICGRGVGLKDL